MRPSLHRLFSNRLVSRITRPPSVPQPQTTPEPPPTLLSTLSTVLRFGAAAYIMQVYVCNTTMAVGPSMYPTLNPKGDVLFAEYVTPRFGLNRGDVVVAVKPTDPRISILKRIRGLGGDKIWVHPSTSAVPIEITVPKDHVWLEGDNSSQSTDSRHYGPVPVALVRGRARLRVWPPSQACILHTKVIDHTEETRRALEIEKAKKERSMKEKAVKRTKGER